MKEPKFKVGDQIICVCGSCGIIMTVVKIRNDEWLECDDESAYYLPEDIKHLRKVTKLDRALK